MAAPAAAVSARLSAAGRGIALWSGGSPPVHQYSTYTTKYDERRRAFCLARAPLSPLALAGSLFPPQRQPCLPGVFLESLQCLPLRRTAGCLFSLFVSATAAATLIAIRLLTIFYRIFTSATAATIIPTFSIGHVDSHSVSIGAHARGIVELPVQMVGG